MAQKFQTIPSNLVGLTDPWDAYRFNRAVYHFGTELEEAMNKVPKGRNDKQTEIRRMRVLQKWIPEAASGEKQFRDPAKG